MGTAPNWEGATIGSPPLAAQVNQLLGTHSASIIYQGALVSSNTTVGTGSVNSNGNYIAQQFSIVGSNGLGRIAIYMSVTGTPPPMTITIQGDTGGTPNGTIYQTTIIPPDWGNATPGFQSIPFPITGVSSGTYLFVTQSVGDASDYYTFYFSTTAGGGYTSTNGTAWTATTDGFLFESYDQTFALPVRHTWEDGNARIVNLQPNTNGTIGSIEEYTVAQGTNQFMYSYRTLNYNGVYLISIS